MQSSGKSCTPDEGLSSKGVFFRGRAFSPQTPGGMQVWGESPSGAERERAAIRGRARPKSCGKPFDPARRRPRIGCEVGSVACKGDFTLLAQAGLAKARLCALEKL